MEFSRYPFFINHNIHYILIAIMYMVPSRERFLQTLSFKQADPRWVRAYAFIWLETVDVWRTQGYDGPELGWHGEGLPKRFELDESTKVYINHEGIMMREFKEHGDTSMPQFLQFPVEITEDFEELAAERLALNFKQRFPEIWKRQVAEGCLCAVAEAANIKASGDDERSIEDRVGIDAFKRVEGSPLFCWEDRWGGFFGSLRNMMGVKTCVWLSTTSPSWSSA